MRFGRRPLHFALVLLLLGFPASAAAGEAQLSAADAEETVTVQLEHTVISGAGAGSEKPGAKLLGRPSVVEIAKRYLGTPYHWAGASPSGFDCSGFVMYVYSRIGIELPHSSWMLWRVGKPAARKDLRPGDLVFFNGLGHVGIYVGRGRFIHSPQTGDVVRIQRLSDHGAYDGARRL
jgi:cell wall-associated NlpC family hydrolase